MSRKDNVIKVCGKDKVRQCVKKYKEKKMNLKSEEQIKIAKKIVKAKYGMEM